MVKAGLSNSELNKKKSVTHLKQRTK